MKLLLRKPGAEEVERAEWIKVGEVKDILRVEVLSKGA